MQNKDNNHQPILIKHPTSGNWINISKVFELQNDFGPSFQDLASGVEEDVIRFINENCIIGCENGEMAQKMFFLLYAIMDTFKSITEVKS